MQKNVCIRSIEGLRKGAFVLALFLLLANVRTAFAHGGAQHVMGTATNVSAQSITVETTDKKVVEVGLNSKTKYTRNAKKVAQGDVKVGDRVMIEAKEVNEKLVADSVKLGAAPSKSEHAAHSK
jgi:hypothetical protein